jgi:hypothetical protein
LQLFFFFFEVAKTISKMFLFNQAKVIKAQGLSVERLLASDVFVPDIPT